LQYEIRTEGLAPGLVNYIISAAGCTHTVAFLYTDAFLHQQITVFAVLLSPCTIEYNKLKHVKHVQ